MELKTQGTELFVLTGDSAGDSPDTVLKVGKLTSIDGVGGSASDIDVTNFDSEAMEFLVGLLDNGSANFGLNLDPDDDSHVMLQSLAGGPRLKWAIGMSDDTTDPTEAGGAFVLPSTRTWLTFEGSLQQWQYAFAVNDAVRVTAAIRISGAIDLTPKT